MNSAKLQSANKQPKTVYQQNQIKSICFLVLMAVILVLTSLLALRAGSYATPLNELIKGIFGLSGDDKINLVVRNNSCLLYTSRSSGKNDPEGNGIQPV